MPPSSDAERDQPTRSLRAEPPDPNTPTPAANSVGMSPSVDHFADRLLGLARPDPNSTRDADAAPETRSDAPRHDRLLDIPGYDILEELGRGGMGVVYKARETSLGRLVAVKTVLGRDRSGAVRFLAEAEAVAAVRHPHVVQVHAYGEAPATTDSPARPYMVLEYLGGGTLADRLRSPARRQDACDTPGRRLDPAHATELIGKVAAGVAAAHELGIVHRDLKPGNILFDAPADPAGGQPKVADFGLVKRASGSDLTRTGDILGTPAYMAPEQGVGRSKYVGPPADVWALGVILYEALTGVRPFRDPDTGVLLRKAAEEDPQRPRTLVPDLPRDLELICLKCLSKEPQDRYPTAKELADDLGRFRRGEPVKARPIGSAVLLARWTRRNPVTAALLAVVAVISVGLVLAVIQSDRRALDRFKAEADLRETERRVEAERLEQQLRDERLKRERAEAAAREAELQARLDAEVRTVEEVIGSLVEFGAAADPVAAFFSGILPPRWDRERGEAAALFLRPITDRLRVAMSRHPERLARVLALSGNTLKNLGQYRDAEAELTAALDLRRAHLPVDHADTAQTMLDLGRVKGELGDLTTALALFREAHQSFRRTNAPEAQLLTARMYEAVALTVLGDPAAETIFREVIAGRQRVFPPHHRDTVFAQMGYLAFLLDQHREAEALALLPPVLEGLKAQPDGQFAQVAGMVSSYQIAVGARMSADKASNEFLAGVALRNAEGLLKQCIANGTTFLPHDHVVLSFVRFELGVVQDRLKKHEEADRTFAELMDALRATTGLAQPKVLVVLESYCDRLGRRKRVDEARKLFDEVDAANRKSFGEGNYWRPILLLKRVDFEVEYGTRDRAIPFAREAVALADKGRLIPNRDTAKSLYEAAKALGTKNATPEAKALAKRLFAHAHPAIDRAYGNPSKEKVMLLRDHGDRLYLMGDRAEGAELLQQADRMAAALPQPLTGLEANLLAYYLGRVALARGQYPDAERYFTRALALSRKFPEKDLADRIEDANGLAQALVGQGRAKEAVPLLEEARRWTVARKAPPADVMFAERLLAAVRLAAGEQGDYRADIRRMVARYAQSKDLTTQSNLIRTAGLADGVAAWDAGDSARKMVPRLSAFGHRSRALALLRADDLTGAELEVKKAVAAAKRVDPIDEAIRGLAALRRGDIGAARACLWRAESLIEAEKPSAANPFAYADSVWINRLTNDLLVAGLRAGLPAPDPAPPPRPVR